MKRYIKNADDTAPSAEDRLNDTINVLKDNFNFAIDGIEKIAADGDISRAIELANSINDMINASINDIASDIAE